MNLYYRIVAPIIVILVLLKIFGLVCMSSINIVLLVALLLLLPIIIVALILILMWILVIVSGDVNG